MGIVPLLVGGAEGSVAPGSSQPDVLLGDFFEGGVGLVNVRVISALGVISAVSPQHLRSISAASRHDLRTISAASPHDLSMLTPRGGVPDCPELVVAAVEEQVWSQLLIMTATGND